MVATFIMDIVALFMTSIMIYHVKTKYTAIGRFSVHIWRYSRRNLSISTGRKEIVMFFQFYLGTVIFDMLLVTSIVPKASILYPVRLPFFFSLSLYIDHSWYLFQYFTAAHIGLISTTFWCLLLNGFVGFQFAEDGTPISLWVKHLIILAPPVYK